MFCPIKHLSPKDSPTSKCNPHCAWAIKRDDLYACAFAVMAASGDEPYVTYNVAKLPADRHERP